MTRVKTRCAGVRTRAWRVPGRWLAAGLLAVGVVGLFPGVGGADGAGDPPADASASGPAPNVPLDRLFELPSGFEARPAEQRHGDGEAEWRARFTEARARLERSEAALAASKAKLAEQAESSNAWSVAPPVGGLPKSNSDAPLNYELSQRIKKDQREVDAAKKGLLDLEVEANLAGVPQAWREAPAEVGAP